MYLRRPATAAVLAVAVAAIIVPAQATVPTCNGLDATIVGTDAGGPSYGTDGPDVVVLGAGNDTFVGKGGDDTICGGGGNDTIFAGSGNDTVFGEAGDDTVYEDAGDDTFDGGTGVNEIRYTYAPIPPGSGLVVNLRNGDSSGPGVDHFTRVTRILGTPDDDVIIGSARAEYLDGYGGDRDVIYGYGGDDVIKSTSAWSIIDAGDGNDRVSYRSKKVSIRLGDGNDRLAYYVGTVTGGIAAGNGTDTVWVGWNTTGYAVNLDMGFIASKYYPSRRQQLLSFEKAVGSGGPDLLVGNRGPNGLNGGAGDDLVYGHGGDDTLTGGVGRDRAFGGPGNDTCVGFEVRLSC